MIKLRKAGRHFSASGAGCGYNDKRSFGFDKFIFAEAVFADNVSDIIRIALDRIMDKHLDSELFKLQFECLSGRLLPELSQNDASDKKPCVSVGVNESENINIICNSEVTAHFVALNIA